jgi:hypothetical protein
MGQAPQALKCADVRKRLRGAPTFGPSARFTNFCCHRTSHASDLQRLPWSRKVTSVCFSNPYLCSLLHGPFAASALMLLYFLHVMLSHTTYTWTGTATRAFHRLLRLLGMGRGLLRLLC